MKNPCIVRQTCCRPTSIIYYKALQWYQPRRGLEIIVLYIHLKTNNCIYAFDNNNSPYEVDKEE